LLALLGCVGCSGIMRIEVGKGKIPAFDVAVVFDGAPGANGQLVVEHEFLSMEESRLFHAKWGDQLDAVRGIDGDVEALTLFDESEQRERPPTEMGAKVALASVLLRDARVHFHKDTTSAIVDAIKADQSVNLALQLDIPENVSATLPPRVTFHLQPILIVDGWAAL